MSEWISVDTELPDSVGRYLAIRTTGFIETAIFIKGPIKWNDCIHSRGRVTHWMPLPEPPTN